MTTSPQEFPISGYLVFWPRQVVVVARPQQQEQQGIVANLCQIPVVSHQWMLGNKRKDCFTGFKWPAWEYLRWALETVIYHKHSFVKGVVKLLNVTCKSPVWEERGREFIDLTQKIKLVMMSFWTYWHVVLGTLLHYSGLFHIPFTKKKGLVIKFCINMVFLLNLLKDKSCLWKIFFVTSDSDRAKENIFYDSLWNVIVLRQIVSMKMLQFHFTNSFFNNSTVPWTMIQYPLCISTSSSKFY